MSITNLTEGRRMSVGSRLKEWRIENKLKTTEIKEKTGISTGGFSDYENDKKLVGSKTLITLAEFYDIDVNYILTGVRKNAELTLNEKELLEYFKVLPDREQIKFIGRIEEIAEKYKENNPKSSNSKIG